MPATDASMVIEPLSIAGAFRIVPVQRKDDRGFFARAFCAESFVAHGLETNFVQRSTSFNLKRGTLRGSPVEKLNASPASLESSARA